MNLSKLGKRIAVLLEEDNKPCTKAKRCAFLQGVLDVTNGKRPGLSAEPFFNMKTGKLGGDKVVVWAARTEFAELSYCPFCGKKIS